MTARPYVSSSPLHNLGESLTSSKQALFAPGQQGTITTSADTNPSIAIPADDALAHLAIPDCVEASLVNNKANELFARKLDRIRKN